LDSSDLVWLEAVAHPDEHRDQRPVAPCRIPKEPSFTNALFQPKPIRASQPAISVFNLSTHTGI
jgi:hypothetical protein